MRNGVTYPIFEEYVELDKWLTNVIISVTSWHLVFKCAY